MSKNELKPCPFCGNAAKIRTNVVNEVKYYQVYCPNKNCSCMPNTIQWISQENAVNAWNNRPGQRPYTHDYNEEEVKKLAEERNITEAKARYLIYQRDYGREYRKKNKERLSEYHKKWDFENRDRISLQARERYKNKKEETDGIFSEDGN